MRCRGHVLQIFILVTGAAWAEVNDVSDKHPTGILESIIIKLLESLRPKLADLKTGFQRFETGKQEFGNFSGHWNEVTIEGLEKFQIKELQTWFLDLKNLTIVEEEVRAKGLYKVDGLLAFPLSRNDIHLFGEGSFRAKISNFSITLKLKMRNEEGKNVVKELDIMIGVEKINMHLSNLMGDKELEKVFNTLMNDVGLTVFDYYKDPILEVVKPKIKDFINELLNREKDFVL